MDEIPNETSTNGETFPVLENRIVALPRVIPLSLIDPDPEQPRRHFDPEKLQELVDSIRSMGLIQPPAVRPHPDPVKRAEGRFMLICGERRWRASQLAGLDEIRCEAFPEMQEVEVRRRQFKENFDRDDLNIVEEAEALDRMLQSFASDGRPAPQERLAAALAIDKGTLSRKLSVLRYPADVRGLVRDGVMTQINALAKVSKLPAKDRETFVQHAYQQANKHEKLDVAGFMKNPAVFLRRVKGELQVGDVINPPAPAKTKPVEMMLRWVLTRADVVKLAEKVGERDLAVFLQEATDEELKASFTTLKAKILDTLPQTRPSEAMA
jgi:ParB family chromosome partitioning protein